MGWYIVGRAHFHGAEFQNLEMGLVDAHPLLPEENGAGIVRLDGNG